MQNPINSKVKRVVTLGPEGSFHHLSLLKFLKNESVEIKLVADFQTIFEKVESEVFGWIAIENSKAGTVANNATRVIEEFTKISEFDFEILLSLSSKTNKPFTHILSHPKAWQEAEYELLKNYPEVKFIPTNSTAEAAKIVSDATEDYAAICHPEAAIKYELNIIAKELVPQNTNITKFVFFQKMK